MGRLGSELGDRYEQSPFRAAQELGTLTAADDAFPEKLIALLTAKGRHVLLHSSKATATTLMEPMAQIVGRIASDEPFPRVLKYESTPRGDAFAQAFLGPPENRADSWFYDIMRARCAG